MTARDRQKRIQALQALIERPGTPAEGEAARRALARVQASVPDEPEVKYGIDPDADPYAGFARSTSFMRDSFREFEGAVFAEIMREAREAMDRIARAHAEKKKQAAERAAQQKPYDNGFRRAQEELRQKEEARRKQQEEAEKARQRTHEYTAPFAAKFASVLDDLDYIDKLIRDDDDD